MEIIQNYIDGQQMDGRSGSKIDIFDPARGVVYAQAPKSGISDVDLAVEAASKAFKSWGSASIEFRYDCLMRIVRGIEDRFEELVHAESKDNGKPEWLARKVDIPRAKSNIEFFATGIKHMSTNTHDMVGTAINYTIRQPLGVVACISPWNLPLYLFTWKIAPALAAGNCVVAKPSEVTPMTAYLFGKICQEAGLPPGVLNIVHGLGPDVGAPLTAHPDVKAISFTGSTATGEAIAKTAAPKFKKLSLEMGGKNPNVIFADCDFDKMMSTTVRSSFANQGQICLCGSRIFIEKSIYEKFKTEFVARVKKLDVGPPKDPESKLGAVVSKAHLEKILSYIDLAKEEGGQILCGGKRKILSGEFEDGYYIEPTIIEGLGHDCRVNQEEIFGPVITIMPFDSEEEVLQFANSTMYGLSATVWTSDLNRAHRMANHLDAGIVWVNTWLLRDLRTPFGGVKLSGVGREGGWDALRFFTEAKNVCIAY